jgi:hypothetical protein
MVANMAKTQVSMWFKAGDTVQFEGRPKRGVRPTITGVVTNGPKGKHSYYGVSTASGQFKVPARLLKPGKVDKKAKANLEIAGAKFAERKASNVEKRDARQLADCQSHMDFFKLARHMQVKNRGVQGWPVVTVLEVDRDRGKCKVTTSTAALMDKVELMDMAYGTSFGSLRRRGVRRTTWVLANRLFPV